MIVKMLTHIHMMVYTWWCWHIYKGGGVCRGEMGFGSLSPSRRACEAGFGAFEKMECLFSIMPDANSWWLAHWTKGEEDRGERNSVSLFNSDRTLSPKRPDAEVVRPVRLSVGTVLRVKHRTLGCVRSS